MMIGVAVGGNGRVVSAEVQDASNDTITRMIGSILGNVLFMAGALCGNAQSLVTSLSAEHGKHILLQN